MILLLQQTHTFENEFDTFICNHSQEKNVLVIADVFFMGMWWYN